MCDCKYGLNNIINYYSKYECVCYDIEKCNIDNLHALIAHGIENPTSNIYDILYYASYYTINKNMKLAIQHYMRVLDDNTHDTANANLGIYYGIIGDFSNMKLFLQRAFDRGDQSATAKLGNYYLTVEKNYEMGKLYLDKAIEMEKDIAVKYYSNFYTDLHTNDINTLLDGFEFSYKYNLDYLWMSILYKYYACDHPITERLIEHFLSIDFEKFKVPSHIKFFINIIKSEINLLETHFNYAPDSDGFKTARSDYIKLLSET
jgi:tetratricopeptide (TPR) repeat protein